jgi:hypothetical protein
VVAEAEEVKDHPSAKRAVVAAKARPALAPAPPPKQRPVQYHQGQPQHIEPQHIAALTHPRG